jgi:hypothetical protein
MREMAYKALDSMVWVDRKNDAIASSFPWQHGACV